MGSIDRAVGATVAGLAGSCHQAYVADAALAVVAVIASVLTHRIDRAGRQSQDVVTAEVALEGGLDALTPAPVHAT